MTPSELITRVMAYTDNVSSTDADYRPRRRRILAWLQEIYDEVWQASEWAWKRGRTTITVAIGDYEAVLPVDFGNIPAEGGVFDGADRYEDVSQHFTSGGREGELYPPSYTFSIYNYSTTSQLPTIQFPTVGPRTVVMYYNRKPPQLADKPPVPVPSAGSGGNTVHYRLAPVTVDGYEHEPSDYVTYAASGGASVLITFPTVAVVGPVGEHKIASWNVYRTTAGLNPLATMYKANSTVLTYGVDLTFLDTTTDGAIVANTQLSFLNQLNQIPSQYHHTVLLPGVISRTRRSKGDVRNWEQDFRQGLAKMVAQERQRKSSVQRVPRSIYGMW